MTAPTMLNGKWIEEFERELGPWFQTDEADDVLDSVDRFDPEFVDELIRQRTMRGVMTDIRKYLKRRPKW